MNLVECRTVYRYSIGATQRLIRANLNSSTWHRGALIPSRSNLGRDLRVFLTRLSKDTPLDEVLNMVQQIEDRSLNRSRGKLLKVLWTQLHCVEPDYLDELGCCDDCGTIVYTDDSHSVSYDHTVCEICRDNNYTWSSYSDEYISNDDARPMYDTRSQYRNSSPAYYCHYDSDPDDYIYNRDEGAFFERDLHDELFGSDDYDDNEGDGENPLEGIGDYHSCKNHVGHIPSYYDNERPRLLLGLELEVECDNHSRYDSAAKIRNLFNKEATYCGTENDGSLNCGFEIVTGYTGLDVHEKILRSAKGTEVFKGLKSHNTDTCGLHVHVDRADITPIQALRLVDFVSEQENRGLIEAIARRYNTGYCVVKRKGEAREALTNMWGAHKAMYDTNTALHSTYLDGMNQLTNSVCQSRYEAINFQNYRTIEFRLFKGTLKIESIMACLEFSRALMLFVREHPDSQMTTERFLSYIQQPRHRRETRYLRNLLKDKGFSVNANTKELETLLVDKLNKRKQTACVS